MLCEVASEDELRRWAVKIRAAGIDHVALFHEPDLNDQMTAIAVGPVYGDDRKVFKKLKLLKGN